MPHRVANFLKSSTNSIEIQVSNLKKSAASATRRRASPGKNAKSRPGTKRTHSYDSCHDGDAEEHPAPATSPRSGRMVEASREGSLSPSNSNRDQPHQQHHHRLSFPTLHLGRLTKEIQSHSHAALDWKLESPPIVFYGDEENSSGAILSGQLILKVTKEEGLDLESFNASLSIHVSQKRPFATHCNDCATQVTDLHKWAFIERPVFLAKGQHTFPFTYLLEGHHPTTADGPLNSVSYHLKAAAIPRKVDGSVLPTIKFEKVLDVKRSLPVPELPHHSVRVFPPTNIKASVHYPQVIHPIGSNKLSLRLDGIAKHNEKIDMVEYWKLKKITWRLEETNKAVAPACTKHRVNETTAEGEEEQQRRVAKKGIQRTDTRIIGEKALFSGWKANYGSVSDSLVEMDLEYHLGRHAGFTCDARPRDGSRTNLMPHVSHQLILEMVVSQEMAPTGKPSQSAPTGVGRILRMHFSTVLTERAGIGISWDNEAPPIYQDVPPSPPAYEPGERPFFCTGAIEAVIEPLDGAIMPWSDSSPSAELGCAGAATGVAPEASRSSERL